VGVGASKVTVITEWWNGYEDEMGHVDFSGLRALACNYCGHEESIFYPVGWGELEYVCPRCLVAGDDGDDSV
jgi:hypothetical protein